MARNRYIRVKQQDATDCGPACVASVAAWHKSYFPVAGIRQIAGTDKQGTSALGLVRAFESIGMIAKGIRCKAEHLDQIPFPAIAHVVLKNQLQHYMVIYGISNRKVRIMDPATGRIENLSREEFESIWSGVLIISAPGADYQPYGNNISNRRRFLYLLRPHRHILIQAVFGAVLYTLLGFSTSVYIQKLTDYMIVFQLHQALHIASFIMLIIIALQIILSVVKNKMILRTGQLIDARLVLGYYRHLLQLPQRFFDSMRVGEIISRINDAAKIRHFLSDTSINFILNVLIILFSCIVLFLFHWKLAMVVSLILPAYGIIFGIANRINRKQERIIMEKSAELESHLVESINNIRTVKQLNLEHLMAGKMEYRFIDLLKAGYKSGTNSIFTTSGSEIISKVFTLLILWLSAVMIFRNELTTGQMMSFYTILGYMSGPAAGLISINRIYQNANIAANRLFEIMELEKPAIHGTIDTSDLTGKDIVFNNVHFSYGTRGELFSGLNLSIEPGTITAIIGDSGSGKSSLAQLISGLYEINRGSLSIGNHLVSHYSPDSLRKCIAIVPQHTELFSGSILENIVPGVTRPDMERVMEICSKTGLTGLLNNLPRGIITQVGEKGMALSGGERQKIALARALYRQPSILILDEATSSMDSGSELMVLKIMVAERDLGKTIIYISHRLRSTSFADNIVIMEKGKVLESGKQQLLSVKKGHYHHLMNHSESTR
jgi:ATP-binding cassette, subfamily C, bacteriocin exporter